MVKVGKPLVRVDLEVGKSWAEMGKTTIEGFPSDSGRIVPNWLADWVYKNNETGEIFAMEW